MAWLEQRGDMFRIGFRFRGEKFRVNLKATEAKELITRAPFLESVMRTYFAEDHPGGVFAFCSKSNVMLTDGQTWKAFLTGMKGSKWHVLRGCHAFRHSFGSLKKVLSLLREYDLLHDGRKDRSEDYRSTLEEQPWKSCPCSICKRLGIHVVLFRGAERNRRRGFHNVYVTYQRLQREISHPAPAPRSKRRDADSAER